METRGKCPFCGTQTEDMVCKCGAVGAYGFDLAEAKAALFGGRRASGEVREVRFTYDPHTDPYFEVWERRDNSVINALKRLERAGDKHSKTTERLLDATRVLAQHIYPLIIAVEAQPRLPRGYHVVNLIDDMDARMFLAADGGNLISPDRKTALDFARDIADGFLDELANWLLARSEENSEAAHRLKLAAEALEAEGRCAS